MVSRGVKADKAMTTPSYNGYVSRAAYLEAQRQEALELAERSAHEHGEGHSGTVSLYKWAKRLAEEIQEEKRAKR